MAEETRCPMCSQSNPAGAEECVHCGARLKPLDLSAGGQPEEPTWGREPPAPEPEPADDDWLARMRTQAEPGADQPEPVEDSWEEEPEPPPAEGELPAEEEDIEAPLRDLSAEAEPAEEVPEWLRRVRSRTAEPDEPEAEQDWVSQLRPTAEADPGREEFETEALEPEAGAEDLGPAFPEPADPEPPAPESAVPEPPAPEPAVPEPPAPEPAVPEPPVPEPPSPEPAIPEQLAPELPLPEPLLAEEPEPADPSAGPPPAPGEPIPSWLQEIEPGEPEEAAADEGLEKGEGPELPRVPALILDEEPEGPEPEKDLDGVGVPDWIGEAEASEDELPAPEEGGVDLAPATLPTWLEAMRPVETFRQVQIEAEDDQAVESAGPLAGLSGVLMAEPVVAMPRTGTVGSMQLAVTERQYAQAELLARMVEEEEQELPLPKRRRTRLGIIRWVIAALIVLATALPVFTGGPRFALPSLEPRELSSLFSLVEAVPADRTALLVFDYEPGYSGELDAVGGAMIEQIMMREVPIATMTTRPTGSPLAVRTIGRLGAEHGYQVGENTVHLGYLSGGPTAVQLFSIQPRSAIRGGFALPADLRESGLSAWETPVLAGVDSLDDFGLVLVFTAGTETARVWAEQAKARMGNTPLIMVVSAGAEPMVRPYFEARMPRISGILTGLPAATAYERRAGQPGLAQTRWNAFGSAMLAAELVLLAGIAYGAAQWWFSRRGD